MGTYRSLVVCWADPGETIGWSLHKVSCKHLLAHGQVGSVSVMRWSTGQFKARGTSEGVDQYLGLCRLAYERACDEDDIFVIGAEDFVLMQYSTDRALLEPVRFNAVLDDRLRGSGQVVEKQMPGDAMKEITDQRLMLWGLYKAGAGHGRDAQRHGLLFLRRWAADERLRSRTGW
jgi:hypothetical protein